MSKRYLHIAAICCVLLFVALAGFLWPESKPLLPLTPPPQRILLENLGGRVVFEHQAHAERYNISCESCHHERSKSSPIVSPCGTCHGVVEKPDFAKNHTQEPQNQVNCVTCHHNEFAEIRWNHARHQVTVAQQCGTCHHTDQRSLPEKKRCITCHKEDSVRRDKVHLRCNSCHSDWLSQDMKECRACHALTPTRERLAERGSIQLNPKYVRCGTCHLEQNPEDLIPSRMLAFHGQCMSCHEKQGKGPFKKDQCNQCHTK